ncbi:hypothetical protein COLO4_29084 [Corchorus olitorius]|uniref:Uncharacterized protein n=1 Tax=Corchorus olitorius TaxID=93759 RepID=A0A1R3HGL0_9ROSI|nr:hypothetical protein COLO4_29084 [Corchorus olitorius]
MLAWKTVKFLLPIRQPVSQSRQLFQGNFGPLRRWAEHVKPTLQNKASVLEYKVNIRRKYVQEFCLSGIRNKRSIFGVSVAFGAIYCFPHCVYAMDGLDMLVDNSRMESFDALEGEDDRLKLWMLVRKLWLPVFFVFTVFMNLDNPFTVAIRILLFLFSTKPSPSSIYLFIQRFWHRYMRQKPHFYRFKSVYASKVDVQDYKLFCLARVEIGDQKLRLIGILGGWWTLPSSLGIYFILQEQCSGTSLR